MTRPSVAVTALITLLTLVTFSVASAISKTPRGQAAPANTSPPSISGTAAVGNTLQASSGSWSGLNIIYSFQWKRCNSSGGSCTAIAGATGSSYVIGSSDAGDTLQVSVTASNKNGSATATSAPSGVVSSSSGYTNTTLPTISGTAQTGQKLTASNGSWSPTSSSFQYAWHRCQNGSCALSPTNADQNSYVVQPGDVGYTIVAEVAPGGNWSDSAYSKPTATVTSATPTSPIGTADFDGRAKNMTTLYSYETTPGDISTLKQGQYADTWTCLCFNNNSMSLAADSTYGKAYENQVGPGDSNPWNTAAPSTNAAGQVSIRRQNDLGQWTWYAVAVKVPSGWQHPPWATLVSLGYETLASDQVALTIHNNSSGIAYFDLNQNSGLVSQTSTGFYAGTVHIQVPLVPVTYGAWQEFVIGVKWATDNTGAVEVYSRTPGASWAHVLERLNEPTYAYGTTSYGTIDASLSQESTVLDKIGLYFGGYSTSSFPTETVYESGLTRSSDLATAESTLP